ncbi:hypothetical protein MTQ13_14045 [Streptomyces sp. XM4011]|uniref:hypothetical protein n=1 Tax=Streptomyces TaxID=1883 RepID=UPI001FFBC5EA|nr:hypothetical protein [Streptomyces sp. XM4011]MCK1815388.1 hypothetical protein [Streptomyces sp. XM4011]
MRATRVSLPLAAVAALTLVPVTQAAAQPDDLVPCGHNELCFYSEPDGGGEIVYRTPLTVTWTQSEEGEWEPWRIGFADVESIDPPFVASSARGPLPAVTDCAVGVYSEPHQGGEGDAQWVGSFLVNLAPDSPVGSLVMDCG